MITHSGHHPFRRTTGSKPGLGGYSVRAIAVLLNRRSLLNALVNAAKRVIDARRARLLRPRSYTESASPSRDTPRRTWIRAIRRAVPPSRRPPDSAGTPQLNHVVGRSPTVPAGDRPGSDGRAIVLGPQWRPTSGRDARQPRIRRADPGLS